MVMGMDSWPARLLTGGLVLLSLIGTLLVMQLSRTRRSRAVIQRFPGVDVDRRILATHQRLELPSGRVVCSHYHDGVRQRWPCPVAIAAHTREAAREPAAPPAGYRPRRGAPRFLRSSPPTRSRLGGPMPRRKPRAAPSQGGVRRVLRSTAAERSPRPGRSGNGVARTRAPIPAPRRRRSAASRTMRKDARRGSQQHRRHLSIGGQPGGQPEGRARR